MSKAHACISSFCPQPMQLYFALQMVCVMVPIGQYTHQERGLNSAMVTSPNTVEVSITL